MTPISQSRELTDLHSTFTSPVRVRLRAMYLLQKIVNIVVVNLAEGNPNRKANVGRHVQAQAVTLGNAVDAAVGAQR